MPYNQPGGVANYFGFYPAEATINPRVRLYMVSSSEAGQISRNDIVVLATDKQTVRVMASRTDTAIMVGVAASVVLAGDGSTGASPRVQSSQNCLVWDDPNTVFVVTDTTSGVLGAGQHIGKLFQVAATGVVGS